MVYSSLDYATGKKHNVVVKKVGAMTLAETGVLEMADDRNQSNARRQPTIVYRSSPAWLRLTLGLDPGAPSFGSGRSVELRGRKMRLDSQDSRRQGNLGVEGKTHGI
jgi:hypothetical protein